MRDEVSMSDVLRGIQQALLVCSILCVVLLPACNIGQKTTVLSLDTMPTSVPAGTTYVFSASISHNNGNFEGANWTLSQNGQACAPACGTLSGYTNSGSQGNGDTTTITYTAPSTVPSPNSATITATSIENTGSSQSDTFTIVPNTAGTPSVTTFALPQGMVGAAYPATVLDATGGYLLIRGA